MRKVIVALGVVALLVGGLFAIPSAGPPFVAGKRVAAASSADVDHSEDQLAGKGGLQLFCQSWRPASEPRAAVVIVHGLKDYSDRYADFAAALVKRGYAVHALDLRGHGASPGDRVWVDGFGDFLDDVGIFVQRVQAKEPGKKIFLFGHSMGGAIATLYTLTREPKPAGLITSAAALKTTEPAPLVGFVKLMGDLRPRAAIFELNDADFSRDPKVVASMASDPLIYDGKAPAHTAAEVLGAIAQIRDRAATLDVPLLALHGSADKVTPPEGSDELVAAAKTADKKVLRYEGLVHDLVHEPERQKVFDDVAAWLDAHTDVIVPP